VSIVVSKAVDELGNSYELGLNGFLTKLNPSQVVQWSIDATVQPTLGQFVFPNNIALDKNKNVWVAYNSDFDVKQYDGTNGAPLATLTNVPADALTVTSTGDFLIAYDSTAATAWKVRIGSLATEATYDLTDNDPNLSTPAHKQYQITSSVNNHAFVTAYSGGTAKIFEIDYYDDQVACYDLGITNPPSTSFCDNNGRIWVSDITGNIARWDEIAKEVDRIFFTVDPGVRGYATALTIDPTTGFLHLQDDGSFADEGRRYQLVRQVDGTIASSTDTEDVAPLTGDIFGFHFENIVLSDVTPTPPVPVVNTALITATVTPAGRVVVTGLPGAITDGDVVEILQGLSLVASPTLNADGSFSYRSSAGFGNPAGGENLDIKGKNTLYATESTQTVVTTVRDLGAPQITFITGSELVKDEDTFIKFGLRDNLGNPITGSTTPASGDFVLRIKDDQTGLFWNGSSYVADDGEYLTFSYDGFGDQNSVEVAVDTLGQVSIYMDEPEFGFFSALDGFVISDRGGNALQSQIDQIQSDVTSLVNDPSIVWLTSLSNLTDIDTVGGFLLQRLDRMIAIMQLLQARVSPVREVTAEGITVDIDPICVRKGDTPLITIRVLDPVTRQGVDINGAEVRFVAGPFPSGAPIVIDKVASVSSVEMGNTGTATLQLESSDTATADDYAAEVVVTFPGGKKLTSKIFVFQIADTIS
jgi:hypothetical protein